MVLLDAAYAGGGFVIGAFIPAVGRKIKAAFVALAKKIVADVKADEAKLVTAAEAEAKKV